MKKRNYDRPTSKLTRSIISGNGTAPKRLASRNKSSAATSASEPAIARRDEASLAFKGRASPIAVRSAASIRSSRARSRSFSSASFTARRYASRCLFRSASRSSAGLPSREAHFSTNGSNKWASQSESIAFWRSPTSRFWSCSSSSKSQACIAPFSVVSRFSARTLQHD